MRRRPNEPSSYSANTNVFSSDAWAVNDSTTSYTNNVQPESEELKQYAAKSIPQGASRTTKAARYEALSNSGYYDQNKQHVTNSDQDPFQSAVLETRPTVLAQQPQTIVEPTQPLRKTHLGFNQASQATTTTSPPQTPAQVTPQAPQPTPAPAPAAYQTPTTVAPQPTAPQVPTPDSHQTPTQSASQPSPVQPTPAPVAPQATQPTAQPVTQQAQAPKVTQATSQDIADEEIVIADFELEFEEAKRTQQATQKPDLETEINLPAMEDLHTPTVQFSSPALFSTGSIPAVSASNDFFDSHERDINSSTEFYDDEPTHKTLRIDGDLIVSVFKNAIGNKIAIAIVAIILALGAYFVVQSFISGSDNTPNVESNSPNSKTVITDGSSNTLEDQMGDMAPTEGVINNAPGQEVTQDPDSTQQTPDGVTVFRDQDGRVVYSSETNTSFGDM